MTDSFGFVIYFFILWNNGTQLFLMPKTIFIFVVSKSSTIFVVGMRKEPQNQKFLKMFANKFCRFKTFY